MLTAVLVVSVVLSAGLVFVGLRKNLRERSKRREWETADAFFLAGGAGGASLLDLYLAANDHEAALDALQHVARNIIPADASPMEWAAYFQGQLHNGDRSVDGLVSLWKGSLAEDEAVTFLNSQNVVLENGLTAHRFSDPTHPDTDVYFSDASGNAVSIDRLHELGLDEYQIKSYSPDSLDSFLTTARTASDQHFIVNHELYSRIEETGRLSELQGRVVDGGWSDVVLENQAHSTLETVSDGLDVSDHIPIIGLFLFGAKAAQNIEQVKKGKQTAWEGGVDTAVDAGRMLTAGAAAIGVGKIGAAIGTAIMPGVGTLVGGIVGALGGALGIGVLFGRLKNWIKYGEIMEAAERIGATYSNKLMWDGSAEHRALSKNLIRLPEHEVAFQQQTALAQRHQLPSSLGESGRPKPEQALLARAIAELGTRLDVARISVCELRNCLVTLRYRLGLRNDSERAIKQGHGFIGTLVASQSGLLLEGCSGYEQDVQFLRRKSATFPHHPYRLMTADRTLIDEAMVLKTLTLEAIASAEGKAKRTLPFWTDKVWSGLWAILVGVALLVIVWAVVLGNSLLLRTAEVAVQPSSTQSDISSQSSAAILSSTTSQAATSPPTPAASAECGDSSAVPMPSNPTFIQSEELWNAGNRWVYQAVRAAQETPAGVRDEAAVFDFRVTREALRSSSANGVVSVDLVQKGGPWEDKNYSYAIDNDCISRSEQSENSKVFCMTGSSSTSVEALGRSIDVLRFETDHLVTFVSKEIGLVKWIMDFPDGRVMTTTLIGYRLGERSEGDWAYQPMVCDWRHRANMSRGKALSKWTDPESPERVLARNAELNEATSRVVSRSLEGSPYPMVVGITDGNRSVVGIVEKDGSLPWVKELPCKGEQLAVFIDDQTQERFAAISCTSDSLFGAVLFRRHEQSVQQIMLMSPITKKAEYSMGFSATWTECIPRISQRVGKETLVGDLKLDWEAGNAMIVGGSLPVNEW